MVHSKFSRSAAKISNLVIVIVVIVFVVVVVESGSRASERASKQTRALDERATGLARHQTLPLSLLLLVMLYI